MNSVLLDLAKPVEVIRGALPKRIRALFVTTPRRAGAWLTEAFASDSASQVVLEEANGMAAGLARLREDVFDAVFISHDPPDLDALELAQAVRGGGSEEPVLVLGTADPQEMMALAFEVGADGYLCVRTATVRALLWSAARAIERHHLLRENRRLIQAERQRLQYEHQEAERLLSQQRALITDLESLEDESSITSLSENRLKRGGHSPFSPRTPEKRSVPDSSQIGSKPEVNLSSDSILLRLPANLVAQYSELLRAYVIMGSGNLADEMTNLAELLATAGIAPQQAMLLHLKALEELVQGLGSRSARHVMSRADLLILELMMRLAENYRNRYLERSFPVRQLLLPGILPKPT